MTFTNKVSIFVITLLILSLGYLFTQSKNNDSHFQTLGTVPNNILKPAPHQARNSHIQIFQDFSAINLKIKEDIQATPESAPSTLVHWSEDVENFLTTETEKNKIILLQSLGKCARDSSLYPPLSASCYRFVYRATEQKSGSAANQARKILANIDDEISPEVAELVEISR